MINVSKQRPSKISELLAEENKDESGCACRPGAAARPSYV